MKKKISILLILALLSSTFLLSGCRNSDEITLPEKIENKVAAYQTDVEDSLSTLTTPENFCGYLENWATAKGITYQTDDYNNVIMEVETSEAYASAPPTVIICPYDTAQPENSVAPVTTGLYMAKNNEGTGRLKVIFTDNTNNNFEGISALESGYITDDSNVFCLSSGSKNVWSMNTGSLSSYTFTGKAEYTEPENDTAYRISISNLSGGVPDDRAGSYPNPIKRLGNLLANFKTQALIYELADFSGGSSGGVYAQSAEVTIVINNDDFEKFQKKIDRDIEKYTDNNGEDFPEMTYTYEQVELPSQVMTHESSDKFVSMLYTMMNGSYHADGEEGDSVSFTNIGSIYLSSSDYSISAIACSLSDDILTEIDDNYSLICGLSDVTYTKTNSVSGWTGNADSEFAEAVSESYLDYSGDKIKFTDFIPAAQTSFVSSMNDKCNIVNLSLNKKHIDKYVGAILTFMTNQPHTESRFS